MAVDVGVATVAYPVLVEGGVALVVAGLVVELELAVVVDSVLHCGAHGMGI